MLTNYCPPNNCDSFNTGHPGSSGTQPSANQVSNQVFYPPTQNQLPVYGGVPSQVPNNNYGQVLSNNQVPTFNQGAPIQGQVGSDFVAAAPVAQQQIPSGTFTVNPNSGNTSVNNSAIQNNDWASLFFATKPAANANNSCNQFINNKQFSKKIILAPYEVGHARKFRQFIIEFEQAVFKSGQLEPACPVI